MTRLLYGAAPGDVIAVVSDDPTTANAAHKDFGPVTGTVQIWTANRSVQETDLLAANPATLTGGAAIPNGLPTADSKGRIPFYGKDGYVGAYWAKDTDGNWWLLNPAGADVGLSDFGRQLLSVGSLAEAQALLGITPGAGTGGGGGGTTKDYGHVDPADATAFIVGPDLGTVDPADPTAFILTAGTVDPSDPTLFILPS